MGTLLTIYFNINDMQKTKQKNPQAGIHIALSDTATRWRAYGKMNVYDAISMKIEIT